MEKQIALQNITTDPAADMLVKGEALRPYLNHYVATGEESEATLKVIAELPTEKRYLFRVVQCLDWALADCDNETARLDMPYMPNLDEIKKKLQIRRMQLDILLLVLDKG